ncbi:MAG TPA: peptide deformylase [Bacteroidales bacterium]|nr:MAG: peptide deformylase [Bacteroidetes bacterium GWF2_33_38]OFY76377.1 MAG: peptide deformylase [Bacteroidetes bacterium RIFOXYA12_FULL_33_9]OFY88454.1 MAG: peptide deformylase [Bacteroidetes bacterium RIFOXYA2_FULL_33_7]HBF89427.1 peptide deformylase [Bacteroidales bacterium]
MIYPIHVFGSPVLRKVAEEIGKDYPNLQTIIGNMWPTMEKSDGVGLAAPQIGLSIRLFVIDTEVMSEDDESLKNFRKVFINAKIIEESGDSWLYNEGCLSVPTIREDVLRKPTIRIQYYDENFNFYDEVYDGVKARVIQHEYDHIEGKLLVDRVSPLKRRLLKRKLTDISKGIVEVNYKIVSPLIK